MIYLRLVDLKHVFNNLRQPPVFANDLDISTQQGREKLQNLLVKRYEGDALNILPTCHCGHLTGGRNLFTICNQCGTTCLPPLEQPLQSLIWLRPPEGIKTFINPTAWTFLSRAMTSSGFNLLEFLVNPGYKSAGKTPLKLPMFMQHGYERGINNFYDNFDDIMGTLFKLKLIKDVGPTKSDYQDWIRLYRDRIFTEYLPLPSNASFVIESNSNTDYLDKTIGLAIDAMWEIMSVDNAKIPLSNHRKQIRVAEALSKLSTYYSEFEDKTLGKKKGVFRKHIFGGRVHFSARAVISSITDPHRYWELHTPWSLSLQLLKIHITNKLFKRGFSPNEIESLFIDYAATYHPLLDQIVNELIAEAPNHRIPVIFQRNPTLHRGSAQLLYITKVKKDPRDITISLSVLVLSAPNADFDGDELNLMLILDRKMYKRLSRLEPKFYAFDTGEPNRISGNLKLPAPVISTIANWMHEDDNDNTEYTI